MALLRHIKEEDTELGVVLPEAYCRITDITCRSDNSVEFAVSIYANDSARVNGKSPLLQRRYVVLTFDHSEPKSIKKKLYEYLKSLPEYASAADSL